MEKTLLSYFASFTFKTHAGGRGFHNLNLKRDRPITRDDQGLIEQAVIKMYGSRSQVVPGTLRVLRLQAYDRNDASTHHRYRIRFMRNDGSTGMITVNQLPALSSLERVRHAEQVLERNSPEISMPSIIEFKSV